MFKIETKRCKNCESPFDKTSKNQVYCSDKCSKEFIKRHRREYYRSRASMPAWLNDIRLCKVCSQPFTPKSYNQRYCLEHMTIGERKEPLVKNCILCGKGFSAYTKTTAFCSTACRKQARNINKGINKTSVQWNDLREFVIERDNYVCQDCGSFKMDIGLEVHHILPLYSKGDNKETNLTTLCHKCHKVRHKIP